MDQHVMSADIGEETRRERRNHSGRRVRQAVAVTAGAAAVAGVLLAGGAAHAAGQPTVKLAFSPAKISAGSQPELSFSSQNAPSGVLFILQDTSKGGTQWKSVERTNATSGSAYLPPASAGVLDYRILMTEGTEVLAVSPTAVLTVTATPATAPSSTGIHWMTILGKPIWDAIIGTGIAWIFSLFF
jgi:hypothetical protein